MKISIRPMLLQDIDTVFIVEAAAAKFPWPLTQFTASLTSNHQCSVLTVDGDVQGFCIFSRVLDEATLLNLAIHPQSQGQGLAKKLLHKGLQLQLLEGVSQCFLEVRVSNVVAQKLYQAIGFVQVGARKNYYPAHGGRENAWVMSMDMSHKPLVII